MTSGARGLLVGVTLASALLLALPGAASACPTKTHVKRQGKRYLVTNTCTDNFTQPQPCPAKGSTITLWADEEIPIPADRPFIKFDFFDHVGCPDATVSPPTTVIGATTDPDGTPITPKPGKEFVQVSWSETGNGTGGQTPGVHIEVDTQDPVVSPLIFTKRAMDRPGYGPKSDKHNFGRDTQFFYELAVRNPNKAPAEIHIRDRLPGAVTIRGRPLEDACKLAGGILNCEDTIPPGDSRRYYVEARVLKGATGIVNVATLYASCGGVTLPKQEAEWTISVNKR